MDKIGDSGRFWWNGADSDGEADDVGGEGVSSSATAADAVSMRREWDELDHDSDEEGGMPAKVMKLSRSIRSRDLDPECTPLPEEKKVIEAGLEALRSPVFPSPEKQRHCQRLVEELLDSAGVRTSPRKQITPRREARIARKMRDADPWYPTTLARIVASVRKRHSLATGPQVVNWDHIKAPDLNGGFHFCPPDHDLRGTLIGIYTNPETGVFFATFDHKDAEKTSTFFPDWVLDIPHLKRLLSEGDVVEEQKGNRLLLVGQKEGNPFYVHCYTREGGFLVISAFPIFFFGDLTPVDKEEIMILGSRHSRDSLHELTEDLEPVFSSPRGVIYDIAPLLGNPQVPRGVYIRVNRLIF